MISERRGRWPFFKLYRLIHVSPRIVEAIVGGTIRTPPSRRTLLEADLPICWDEQRVLLGLTA